MSLIVSGAAARTPDTRYILSHGGGTITALTGRFLGADASADNLARTPPPNSRLYQLRRFYYDTAASTNPVNIQSLKMLVGVSQIVFGTDHPFGNSATNGRWDINVRPLDLDREFPLVKENRMSRTRAKARDYMHACTTTIAGFLRFLRRF